MLDYCPPPSPTPTQPQSAEESETWTFMGVLFEDDARRQLLQKLGFADALAAAQQQRGAAVARASSSGVAAAAEHLASAVEQMGMLGADGEGVGLLWGWGVSEAHAGCHDVAQVGCAGVLRGCMQGCFGEMR